MVRVLIVEDSPVIQELMVHILKSDSEINVVGVASNGEEAIELVKHKKPDVITMDIHMPRLDGLSATRKIMETYPTPIIIVSSTILNDEVPKTFQLIEAGALAVLNRPAGIGHPDFQMTSAELINSVKLMSEVKVVKRWSQAHKRNKVSDADVKKNLTTQKEKYIRESIQAIAIGASTGGPLILQIILSSIGKNFPVPVLIVQHIAKGFLQGFVEWLSITSDLPIHIAAHRELILPGNVYVAPDGFQMGVDQSKRIMLSKDLSDNNLIPSISYLFKSVVNIYGSRVVGVLLSGMGKDGAKELKLMKDSGAVTIAQNAESSVVHGMPGEAIQLEGATYILSPEKITETLKILVNNNLS